MRDMRRRMENLSLYLSLFLLSSHLVSIFSSFLPFPPHPPASHLTHTKGFFDLLFETVEFSLVSSSLSIERFVQLGCGWLLREISLSERKRVISFIEKHHESFSREGLRYAIEKMTESERRRLMNFKKGSGSGRARKRVSDSSIDEANEEMQVRERGSKRRKVGRGSDEE